MQLKGFDHACYPYTVGLKNRGKDFEQLSGHMNKNLNRIKLKDREP
jgi:hypothetical protein